MPRAAFLFVAVLIVLAACRENDERPVSSPAPAAPSAAIELGMDEQALGPLDWRVGDPPVVLRHAAPPNTPSRETWHTLVVKNERASMQVEIDAFRAYDVWLYQRDDGKAMAGLFRRDADGTPPNFRKPIRAVVDPTIVQIQSRQAAAQHTELTLHLVVDGVAQALPVSKMRHLRNARWGSRGRRRRAWAIRDVIALSGSLGNREIQALTFFNAQGTKERILPADDIDALVMRPVEDGFHIKKKGHEQKTLWRFRNATRLEVVLGERHANTEVETSR